MMDRCSRKKLKYSFFPSIFQNSLGKRQFLSLICSLLCEALCWHKTQISVPVTQLNGNYGSYSGFLVVCHIAFVWIECSFQVAVNVGVVSDLFGVSDSGINLSGGSVLCMLTDLSPHQDIKLCNVPLTSSSISLAPARFLGRRVNTWSTLMAVAKTAAAPRGFRVPYRGLPAFMIFLIHNPFTVVNCNCQQAFKLLCLPYLRKHRRISSLVLPFSVKKHPGSAACTLGAARRFVTVLVVWVLCVSLV